MNRFMQVKSGIKSGIKSIAGHHRSTLEKLKGGREFDNLKKKEKCKIAIKVGTRYRVA